VDWVLDVGADLKHHEAGWQERQKQAEKERQEADLIARQNREKILQK